MAFQDPRVVAEEYLERHKVPQLFEAITAQLLFYKPDQPREFICKYIEQVKVTGTPTLLTKEDLETMFGMFDVTKKGIMSAEQANAALKSILGPAADLRRVGIEPDAMLRKEQFVDAMHKALAGAAPYRPPTSQAPSS